MSLDRHRVRYAGAAHMVLSLTKISQLRRRVPDGLVVAAVRGQVTSASGRAIRRRPDELGFRPSDWPPAVDARTPLADARRDRFVGPFLS